MTLALSAQCHGWEGRGQPLRALYLVCRKIGAEGSVLQELCHFVILTARYFCAHFFMIFLCIFSSYCPILFKFSPHLNHHTLHVLLEKRGWRVSIARVMPLCNFNCKMFTIVLIVHVLWNQLLLQLPVYPFNTLQICYTDIVDVHEELICRKNIVDKFTTFLT